MVVVYGCTTQSASNREIIKPDKTWLDSIKNKSDTSWTKSYRNKEFATAEYYIDKKDSIVTQLMKDSAGTLRQINIAKYDMVKLFFGEYYANGQLKAKLPLDKIGRYDGQGKYYYENGRVKSEGAFVKGFFSGRWKNYNQKGELISIDEYDDNGQLMKTIQK